MMVMLVNTAPDTTLKTWRLGLFLLVRDKKREFPIEYVYNDLVAVVGKSKIVVYMDNLLILCAYLEGTISQKGGGAI